MSSYSVEIDQESHKFISKVARLLSVSKGEVVRFLIDEAPPLVTPTPSPTPTPTKQAITAVPIYAIYGGHRIDATFDTTTKTVTVKTGSLAGQTYKSPSRSAGAVVASINPYVNPSRNGWHFWILADGSGRFLQSIRHFRGL